MLKDTNLNLDDNYGMNELMYQQLGLARMFNFSKQNDTVNGSYHYQVTKYWLPHELFNAVMPPIIIVIGVIGNSLSLCVFNSKRLRRQASSTSCLAGLSLSDLLVLIVYVFGEWTRRGLPFLMNRKISHIVDRQIVCQVYLWILYTLRMNSVWLLVIFTMERYIGVCHPIQRRVLCTKNNVRKAITMTFIFSIVLSSYKLFFASLKDNILKKTNSTTVEVGTHAEKYMKCGTLQNNTANILLDAVYAFFISLLPFCFILTLNVCISMQLLTRRNELRRSTGPEILGLQLVIVLIALSVCFLALTLPYTILFFLVYDDYRRLHLDIFQSSKSLFSKLPTHNSLIAAYEVTRTLFFMNYSVNFFLYSLAGTFFRNELRRLFRLKKQRDGNVALNPSADHKVGNIPLIQITSGRRRRFSVTNNKHKLVISVD